VGLFPEQAAIRERVGKLAAVSKKGAALEVLDLFGAIGGSSMAAAREGASVTYVDASTSALARARRNFAHNGLDVRSFAEDGPRFVARELRRGRRYDALILDPPSFGRGPGGEVWKIERDLDALLENCRRLLSAAPRFVVVTAHTRDWTAGDLEARVGRFFGDLPGETASGPLEVVARTGARLPRGLFALREFR
jgi:23S rRNA (cytosine1962-C5)-methyltransferase